MNWLRKKFSNKEGRKEQASSLHKERVCCLGPSFELFQANCMSAC
jgi:hypothetical protein